MDRNYLPPIEFLRECFSYEPETGAIRWNTRPASHFPSVEHAYHWNLRHSGTLAFQGRDAEGYGRSEVRYEGRRIRTRASRVIFKLMTGREPEQIDHVNGDETDDRWSNLRAATNTDNARNKIGRQTKHWPKGVFVVGRKFQAQINIGNDTHRLGLFETPSEAHAAYCAAARAIHGEFFNPGPPRPTIFD